MKRIVLASLLLVGSSVSASGKKQAAERPGQGQGATCVSNGECLSNKCNAGLCTAPPPSKSPGGNREKR
jgi:hypothetical protein